MKPATWAPSPPAERPRPRFTSPTSTSSTPCWSTPRAAPRSAGQAARESSDAEGGSLFPSPVRPPPLAQPVESPFTLALLEIFSPSTFASPQPTAAAEVGGLAAFIQRVFARIAPPRRPTLNGKMSPLGVVGGKAVVVMRSSSSSSSFFSACSNRRSEIPTIDRWTYEELLDLLTALTVFTTQPQHLDPIPLLERPRMDEIDRKMKHHLTDAFRLRRSRQKDERPVTNLTGPEVTRLVQQMQLTGPLPKSFKKCLPLLRRNACLRVDEAANFQYSFFLAWSHKHLMQLANK